MQTPPQPSGEDRPNIGSSKDKETSSTKRATQDRGRSSKSTKASLDAATKASKPNSTRISNEAEDLLAKTEVYKTRANRGPDSNSDSQDSEINDQDSTLEMNAPASHLLTPGAVFGHYQIKKSLGQGAMGAVYLAKDLKLEREVALKIPKLDKGNAADLKQRFEREAKAAASLHHPLICPIYEYGTCEDQLYLAMAYVKGKPLSSFIKEGRAVPERQAALLVRKLAIALQAAHENGVVHRDLKPANVMVNERKEPIVMDFGLARRTTAEDAKLTSTGMFVGTPAYTSPEQIRNRPKTVGPAADIYSLGVILYEMLTGQRPFKAKDTMSVLSKVLTEEPKPALQVNGKLSQEISGICMRAMRKDPQKRFATMADFARALTDYLKSSPTPAKASDAGEDESTTTKETTSEAQPVSSQALDLASLDFLQSTSKPLELSSSFASRPKSDTASTVQGRKRGSSSWLVGLVGGLGILGVLGVTIATFVILGGSNRDGMVRLRLNVQPDDLTVSIDDAGIDRRQIDEGLPIAAGSHQLIVQASGYKAEKRWFEVSANENLTLDVQLAPVTPPSPSEEDQDETTSEGTEQIDSVAANDDAKQAKEPPEPVRPQLATGTIILENFEKSTFDGWTVEGGAFGTAPLTTADRPHMEMLLPWRAEIGTFAGSNHQWHPAIVAPGINNRTGKLISDEFVLTHQYFNFYIFGGAHPGRVEMRLKVGDKVVRSQTGFATDLPLPITWDISDLAGETATIEIVDDLEQGYLPYLGVDNLSMSDLDLSKAWDLELTRKIETESIEWNGHKYWFPRWVVSGSSNVWATLELLAARCGGKPVSISSDEEHAFFMNQVHGQTWLGLRGDGNGRYVTPEGVMGSYFRWISGIPENFRGERVLCDLDGDWTTNGPLDGYAYVAFEWGHDSIEPYLFIEPEKQTDAAVAIVETVDHMLLRVTDRYVRVTKAEELPEPPYEIKSIRFKSGFAMPPGIRRKFQDMSSITVLDLPETHDSTLTLVTDLPELRQLSVSGRKFEGRSLARLPNHEKIRRLYFSSVDLHRSIYRYFSETRSLKSLSFRSMGAESAYLAPFVKNENLRSLEINAVGGLGDRGIAMISRFPKLTSLIVWACGMNDINARMLENLSELRSIQLGRNSDFKGGGLQYLAGCKRMQYLSVYATGANDDGMAYMPEFPRLTGMSVGRTRLTDIDGKLSDKLPNLEDLEIVETLIGNDDLIRLGQFQYIRRLHYADSQISDQAANAFADARSGLRLK